MNHYDAERVRNALHLWGTWQEKIEARSGYPAISWLASFMESPGMSDQPPTHRVLALDLPKHIWPLQQAYMRCSEITRRWLYVRYAIVIIDGFYIPESWKAECLGIPYQRYQVNLSRARKQFYEHLDVGA